MLSERPQSDCKRRIRTSGVDVGYFRSISAEIPVCDIAQHFDSSVNVGVGLCHVRNIDGGCSGLLREHDANLALKEEILAKVRSSNGKNSGPLQTAR